MSALVEITLFTDPACPFAFSAEPVRQALRWQYGDQLAWRTVMIVLTREEGEAEKLAGGADGLQAQYGMPIARGPKERPASSEPACRAVVAARLHAPEREDALLRRLRVLTMAGGLLDDPALITQAATEAGIDAAELASWVDGADVTSALEADAAAARKPSPRARALDHRLSGPADARRYSAPSYELKRPDGAHAVPGFNPLSTYEIVLANLARTIERRDPPADVVELLTWAGEPLATAEVAEIMRVDRDEARALLSPVAAEQPAGADAYWTLPA